MSMQHQSSRRRSYGTRNHEIRERIRRRLNHFSEDYDPGYEERDRHDVRTTNGAAIFRAHYASGRNDA